MRFHQITVAALVIGAASALAGCTDSGDTAVDEAVSLGHIHGLEINPGDGRLFVASHQGLFAADEGEPLVRVGDDAHDLMAFAVTGPDTFLASGHPGSADLPNPMGLVRSSDGGVSWSPVSLQGEADLHAIDVDSSRIVAFDGSSRRLLEFSDAGTRADVVAQLDALDVAAIASGSTAVVDGRGRLLVVEPGGSTAVIESAPPLVLVDWVDGEWSGVDARGRVWRSPDGEQWQRRGSVPGDPQAFTAGPDGWFVGSTDGLFVSVDGGHAWARW